MLDLIRFGKRLKKYRELKGLMQKDLAERVGISPQVMSSYENGKSAPSLETLAAIAECLEISIDSLLGQKHNANCEYTVGDAARIMQTLYLMGECEMEKTTYEYKTGDTVPVFALYIKRKELFTFLEAYQRLDQLRREGLITEEIISQWQTGSFGSLDRIALAPQDDVDTYEDLPF